VSLGPVAKLRAIAVAAQGWSATAYPVEVLASHEDADEDATLTIGDLRALLAHIDQLERRATLETPSDNERRRFISGFMVASAYQADRRGFADALLDAQNAWLRLLEAGC